METIGQMSFSDLALPSSLGQAETFRRLKRWLRKKNSFSESVQLMRHLVLDTETTGLSAKEGHRIIEIGVVELVNLSVMAAVSSVYKPERDIDAGAQSIQAVF